MQEYFLGKNIEQRKADLYIASDGFFDVMYKKPYIKSAGICQSILLDVNKINNKS